MTNTLDLDALEALAREATPGEWRSEPPGERSPTCGLRERNLDCWIIGMDAPPLAFGKGTVACKEANDATYIAAANPAVVLTLIKRCREAEWQAKEYKQNAEMWSVRREQERVRAERAEAALQQRAGT